MVLRPPTKPDYAVDEFLKLTSCTNPLQCIFRIRRNI